MTQNHDPKTGRFLPGNTTSQEVELLTNYYEVTTSPEHPGDRPNKPTGKSLGKYRYVVEMNGIYGSSRTYDTSFPIEEAREEAIFALKNRYAQVGSEYEGEDYNERVFKLAREDYVLNEHIVEYRKR